MCFAPVLLTRKPLHVVRVQNGEYVVGNTFPHDVFLCFTKIPVCSRSGGEIAGSFLGCKQFEKLCPVVRGSHPHVALG